MKRKALITVWVIPLLLLLFWVCGLVTGYSLGKAHADQCTGWNGQFFNYSNCGGYVCQGVSFGPFWTQNCNDPYYPPPPVAP